MTWKTPALGARPLSTPRCAADFRRTTSGVQTAVPIGRGLKTRARDTTTRLRPGQLIPPEGPEALLEASLDGGSLTISVPDGSTADGLTAVTVVSKNAAGLPVSWTVLVHVVAVEGYTVQEQAWGETTWHAPEDRGDDWALLWRSNDYRWLAKTTFDGLVTAAYWTFAMMTVDSSRDRWAYDMTKSLGDIPVDPIVTFGGDTLYFQTLNVAHVGLKHADAPSAEQRQIAMTEIESVEWEEVAWSREVWIEDYQTSTGMARLTTGYDGYLVYPHYRHHPEILQPLEHTTVRVKVELAEPVPDGMVGTLHLAWYDPDNTLANEPDVPPSHSGHGRRDNAEDVELVKAGAPLPGFTLEFSTAGPSSAGDSIQKSYLAVKEARYADNFIVAAHPNEDIEKSYEFRENQSEELVLMRPDNTGIWEELAMDHRTSILTIMPSVDIDVDSDNTATPTWHGIDRSDWEEQIENEAEYPGKLVLFNNNDDNNNGIPDYLENADYEYPPGMSWVPFPDPDLVPVVLDRGFANLTGMDGFLFELKVTADTEYGLRYWLDPEKTKIVNGINGGEPIQIIEAGKLKDVYTWVVSSETVNYPPLIYVEGINPEALTDTLMWRLFDPNEQQVDVDTVKVTDPLVILRIDADNNGYINMKNQARAHAEIMLQRQGVAKPITYWGIEHPFGEENRRSEFVPMELEVRGQVGSPFIWYLQIPPTLGVYEFVNDQFIELADTLGLVSGRLEKTLYVKAEAASAQMQTIELLVYSDGQLVPGIASKATFHIQDNSTHFQEWVVPNAWRIQNGHLTTPVPNDQFAIGPQAEGTERGYDAEKNRYSDLGPHQGDTFSRTSYDSGFTLKVDYAFLHNDYAFAHRNTLRPDVRNNDERITQADPRRLSFVANSGVKIGPRFGTDVFEVAIIDVDGWVKLAEDNRDDNQVNFQGTEVVVSPYEPEELSKLLNGVIYDGQYDSMTFVQKNTEGKTDPLATLLAFQKTFVNSSMVIEYNPQPGPGRNIVEVYMKTKEDADPSDYGRQNEAYKDYYLLYASDHVREDRKVKKEDDLPPEINVEVGHAYIRLQSHWGSGVTFTDVTIAPY
jgi:hypothetical protein